MTTSRTQSILAASAGLAISASAGAQIVNGDFETGDLSGWTITATLPAPATDPITFHGGAYSALLGSPPGAEPLGDSAMYQAITVPPGGGVLSFWYNTFTQDSITFDWQDAYIQDNTGANLATIFHLCQTADWTQQTFDLAPYAGQTVRIAFLVHQDGFGDVTSMNIDDVVLGPPLPTGACCRNDGSCTVTNSLACISQSGLYRGDGTACAGAGCAPVSFVTVPLNANFNGMVHGAPEQGEANRSNDLTGYRSVSDRGLLLDGNAGSLNAGPVVGVNGAPYTLVSAPNVLDIVHLGDRNLVDNGTAAWGSNPAQWGNQPAWLPNSNQTGPQTTDVSGLHATLGPQGSIGILYQISNGGGHFDVVLGFTDNSTVTVTLQGPDWFHTQTPAAPGPGVAAQRQLGVYTGTRYDTAGLDEPLNVVEAVITVSSLQAGGMGNVAGRQLASITFQNPLASNPAYPDPTVGAGFAIIATTIGGLSTGPSCYANCDHSTQQPCLNVLDFSCFLNQFAAGASYANCDNSTQPPVLNVLDFSCFLNRFAAGCSGC